MSTIARVAAMKDAEHFCAHLHSLGVTIPCDDRVHTGTGSTIGRELVLGDIKIGNRIAVQPMEGWDGTTDGNPSESTLRRWRRFGQSGAKLIWGGEAVAVCHAGRANPNQLVIAPHTQKGLHQLRTALIEEHRQTTGSSDGLSIGLQLTHSGRFCRPNRKDRAEPRILYRHPILDRRMGLAADYPLLTDSEIQSIIEDFVRAAQRVRELGFDFVDIKHCHGYLGHEFLSAREREGRYGGSFENRTRFLQEIVEGILSDAPGLGIGVRLSAFDLIPFRPDPRQSVNGKPGPGIPEDAALPYRSGFGVNENRPIEPDLIEPERFIARLQDFGIRLVNITGGSPYYNPHVQRPALYPPSDGYLPPEDPLVGVARQMSVTRELKRKFPQMVFVGSAYSYLHDFLPQVAQAAIREGWVDAVGLGRMVLSYPEILWDAMSGAAPQRKRICRTFSDCTSAPRNGLPSGCYPLDAYYKDSEDGARLRALKAQAEPKQAALTNATAAEESANVD